MKNKIDELAINCLDEVKIATAQQKELENKVLKAKITGLSSFELLEIGMEYGKACAKIEAYSKCATHLLKIEGKLLNEIDK